MSLNSFNSPPTTTSGHPGLQSSEPPVDTRRFRGHHSDLVSSQEPSPGFLLLPYLLQVNPSAPSLLILLKFTCWMVLELSPTAQNTVLSNALCSVPCVAPAAFMSLLSCSCLQTCGRAAVDHHGHSQQQDQLQTDCAEAWHHLPREGAHPVSEQAAQDQRGDPSQDARRRWGSRDRCTGGWFTVRDLSVFTQPLWNHIWNRTGLYHNLLAKTRTLLSLFTLFQ